MDTTRKDLEWYQTWLEDAALTGTAEYEAWESYADRAGSSFAVPDICVKGCAQQEMKLKMAFNDATEDECTPLIDFVNCLHIQEEPQCGSSHFVKDHNEDIFECQNSTGRRLRAAGFHESGIGGPLASTTENESPVEYSTVMPGSHLSQLKDGSKALDLSALSEADRETLAGILRVPNLSGTKLIFNQTGNEAAASDMIVQTTEEGVHQDRRLQLSSNCEARYMNKFRWHWIAPSCRQCKESCIHWGCDCTNNPGPLCWPGCQKTHRRFSAGLKIVVGHNADTGGHVTVTASGSMDIAKYFGIPKPMSGTVSLSGSISVSNRRPCKHVAISFSGSVSLVFAIGVDISRWSFTISQLSLSAGGGVTSYKYNCRREKVNARRRRRWSRRRVETKCDSKCDVSIWAKAEVSVDVGVAGVKGWAKVEYYFRNKDFDIVVGADAFIGWPRRWFNVVTKKVM